MANEQIRLYPLTGEDLVKAVVNAGYTNYKPSDFEHNLECEGVWLNEQEKITACYAYTFFNDNENHLERGRLYVTITKNYAGTPVLMADW